MGKAKVKHACTEFLACGFLSKFNIRMEFIGFVSEKYVKGKAGDLLISPGYNISLIGLKNMWTPSILRLNMAPPIGSDRLMGTCSLSQM